MILISHRGNINGPNPKRENRQSYIIEALNKKYQVEIDVWYVDGKWWLGHDKPQYSVEFLWLATWPSLWIHCKNIEALREFSIQHVNGNISPHFFWHEHDSYTITNHGVIWAYPGQPTNDLAICVLPETVTHYTKKQLRNAAGICSDYVAKYKKL